LIHPPPDKFVTHETRDTYQGDPQPSIGAKGGFPSFFRLDGHSRAVENVHVKNRTDYAPL
jgi:hypothetical protein